MYYGGIHQYREVFNSQVCDIKATRFERVKLQRLLNVPPAFIFKTTLHSALKI